MFKRMRHIGALLAMLLIAFSVSVGTGGQVLASSAHMQALPYGVVSSGPIVQPAAQIQAYWTQARMKSALQADILLNGAKLTPKKAQATGPSGSRGPVMPQNSKKSAITPLATPLPQSYYSSYPYSTIGKVFFTDSRTGLNYVCSGASVNSTNLNVVDTAGHCVIQGGSGNNWYTNWQFCPQYYYGSTPLGCWSARQFWSRTEWMNSGSLEDDFGDVVVYPNSHGNLVSVVGGTGWAYGYATNQFFYPFGYPAESPYNGNLIYYCSGTGASYGYDDGTVIAVPCDMTGGSSGGPWLISVNGSFGYVNGHNDFKYNSDPNHMYSPYYDSDWYSVFNAAQTT